MWTAGTAAMLLALLGCANGSPSSTGPESPGPQPTGALTTDALLTSEQMPAWNGAMGWAEQGLIAGGGARTACVLPSAEELGAIEVLTRDFVAAGLDDPGTTPDPTWPASHGTSSVAWFPDDGTAAAAVLAWEEATRECAPRPDSTQDPDSFQITDLPTGSTWSIAVRDPSEACADCSRFAFVGFAARGSAVATVGFSLTGQDANHEGDPLADAMQAALRALPSAQTPLPQLLGTVDWPDDGARIGELFARLPNQLSGAAITDRDPDPSRSGQPPAGETFDGYLASYAEGEGDGWVRIVADPGTGISTPAQGMALGVAYSGGPQHCVDPDHSALFDDLFALADRDALLAEVARIGDLGVMPGVLVWAACTSTHEGDAPLPEAAWQYRIAWADGAWLYLVTATSASLRADAVSAMVDSVS